jgi:acyl-CoA thioesterase I
MRMTTCAADGCARAYGAVRGMRNLALAAVLALAALPAPAEAELTILALGDSLTQGYGLPESEGFVPQLQGWLRANGLPDAIVINGGVSGDTTAGGLARIGWSLTDEVDAVIVALGGNDLLRGIDPAASRANLDGILAEVRGRDLPVLLAGLPAPSNYGPDYKAEFEAIFPALAEEHGALLYPSFLAGMGEGRDIAAVRALMQPDGLHPNAEGVAAIVAGIGPVVLELLAAAHQD